MKLRILTWNLNFFYDNWYDRIRSINDVLEKEIKKNDIIVLQEATVPLLKGVETIFNCLKTPLVKYKSHYTFSDEIQFICTKLENYFPEKKEKIISIFKFLMDKFLVFISLIFSKFGYLFQYVYFEYPYLWFFLIITILPILLLCGYIFLGMMTIVNKNIKTIVKSKFVGRLFQYSEFTFNKKKILLCNIHLNEGPNSSKGYKELKKIIAFSNEISHDILILAGDFNSPPTSPIYKYLYNQGFKSVIKEKHKKDIKTWPTKKPITCIDYIWVKGENIKICSANVFGKEGDTDHKGVKCCLDIK